MDKASAGYVNKSDCQNTCAQCKAYNGRIGDGDGCSKVEGTISASGYCKLFHINLENPLWDFFDFAKHLADKD